MVKVIITAPKGKMGSLILKEAAGRPSLDVAGALGRPGADYIGTEICGVKVSGDLEQIIDQCDLVIDFSTVENSMAVLRSCVAHGKGLICGTTGFTDEQEAEFRKAAETIPMMRASNTSYMVNVLSKMLELEHSIMEEKLGTISLNRQYAQCQKRDMGITPLRSLSL